MTTATEYDHGFDDTPTPAEKRVPRTAQEARDRIRATLENIHARQNGPDLSGYPEDVRPYISRVCDLWKLRAPTTKKSKGYWIQSARELEDACGEFGVDLLDEYRKDYEATMHRNLQRTGFGAAPHTVEGPGSLIKMLRDKARQLREKGVRSLATQDEDERRRYEKWSSG